MFYQSLSCKKRSQGNFEVVKETLLWGGGGGWCSNIAGNPITLFVAVGDPRIAYESLYNHRRHLSECVSASKRSSVKFSFRVKGGKQTEQIK